MKTKSWLLIALVSLVGWGCAAPGLDRGGGHPRYFADKTCDGTSDCWVTVKVGNLADHSSGYTDVGKLIVKQGKKVDIFWKLDPDQVSANCFFYPTAGDGVFLKSISEVDKQFTDQMPVDRPQPPKLEPYKAQWYHWFSKNEVRMEYHYKIVFHCGSDETPFVVDPPIYNEGP